MASINVTSTGFPAANNTFNQNMSYQLTLKKCIKYAVGVGNAHYSRAFRRSGTAIALSAYRSAAIACVLDFSSNPLKLLHEYNSLETTEKANLSFWMGMTAAAFVADKVLNVPRLTHATKQHGLVKVNARSRRLADLVGPDRNQGWHVIEAKARQLPYSQTEFNDWKDQARSVASINGNAIATRSVCVMHLDRNACHVELKDPPSRKPVNNWKIDDSEFGMRYYKPFVEMLQGGNTHVIDKRRVIIRPLFFEPVSRTYVYIGLEEVFAIDVQKGATVFPLVEEYDFGDTFIARDGVVVITSKTPCDY